MKETLQEVTNILMNLTNYQITINIYVNTVTNIKTLFYSLGPTLKNTTLL